MPMQVNLTTKVNSKSIRREQHNGRDHWVIPSYTLPANVVMNGGLYPAAEIDAHYQKIESTLAPLGHPQVNGQFVSAFSPEALNTSHVGAWNRNAKKSGNRIYVEKWLDVETAKKHEGGVRLLERLEALEKGDDVPPIHTSVAVFLERLEANEEQRKAGAEWVAKLHGIDHDAILLDEVGAATPEQGVGMMVNADLAIPLQPNSGALVGETFREREARLDRAAKQRFAPGPDDYAWVADFTDTQAVVVRNGGISEIYDYKTENGQIVFGDTGTPVVRQESWVTTVANSIKKFFTHHQARPDTTKEDGNMPLTAEEKAELVKDIGANVSAALAEQIKPVSDRLDAIEANHKTLTETVTANAKAAEAEKRNAVAEVHGEVVANALSGEALDAMFKSIGGAAPLLSGNAGSKKEIGAPDPAAYFGGAK